MSTYLLDTSTVSYLADHRSAFHEPVRHRLAGLPGTVEVAISILTLYELSYGFLHDPVHSRLLAIVREAEVRIIPLTEQGATVFAELKDLYRRHTGTRPRALGRHNVDLILASSAIVERAVLVSNDGIFAQLAQLDPRLALENWAETPVRGA